MRAAIVGGIIAIITLAAYGIVQAGRWAPAALQARVETPAPVAVEPAPAVATDLELHMERRDPKQTSQLTITLVMRPGSGHITPEWRSRCGRITRDLQAYLMGR